MKLLHLRVLAIALLLISGAHLRADLHCPALFDDHMVLQRDQPVPIWGEAAPGEKISVTFADQRVTTTADASGHWRIDLAPLPASSEPRDLTITAESDNPKSKTENQKFTDVLVGEVWFCSGQSNMEKPFGPRKGQKPVDDSDLEVAAANHPQLRLFQVPRTDLKQTGPGKFHWLPCSPEALRLSDFSAAAYYFGQTIQPILGVPVGLIHASFGGTRIEAWMPHEAFAAPLLRGLDQQHYSAWAKGVQPTELYQSMIVPYAPYALRGFLWYQGEANCVDGSIALYAEKQTALISAWRAAWNRPDAPFYGVLLAPFDYSHWEKFPVTAAALPALWAEQIKALSAPHTGFIVSTDLVGNVHDLHPTNKRGIGLRLARLALAETYGHSEFPAHGPTFASFRVESATLALTFTSADGLRARDGLPLTNFTLAGDDRVFHPAQAKIEADRIILSSAAVPHPVAARFAWHETATPNLVNAAALPAAPFRTDDWPLEFLRPASTK